MRSWCYCLGSYEGEGESKNESLALRKYRIGV
jgi:hypothetical protein